MVIQTYINISILYIPKSCSAHMYKGFLIPHWRYGSLIIAKKTRQLSPSIQFILILTRSDVIMLHIRVFMYFLYTYIPIYT